MYVGKLQQISNFACLCEFGVDYIYHSILRLYEAVREVWVFSIFKIGTSYLGAEKKYYCICLSSTCHTCPYCICSAYLQNLVTC